MLPSHFGSALLALAIGLGLAPAAIGQTGAAPAPSPKRADPLDPRADVPPTHYRSALATYRPNAEQAVGSWRDANDSAGKAGGWRAYAREANAPESPAEPTSGAMPQATPAAKAGAPSPTPPAQRGHGAHGKH